MPAGLQFFDLNGNVILDTTSRIPKWIGQIETNGYNGSRTIDIPSGSTPTYLVVQISPIGSNEPDPLEVTMTATNITWSYGVFSSDTTQYLKATIYWGYC